MKEKRKVHKSVLAILLAIFILPCCFLFTGCGEEVYVSSIEYSYKNGDNSVYTVKYSNGKTSTIDVPGAEITTLDIFKACVERHLFPDTDAGFEEFVNVYLNTSDLDNTKFNIYKAMNSAVSIRCPFNNNFTSAGSGVIFSMDNDFAYIITNCHVITDASSSNPHKLPSAIYVYNYGNEFVTSNVKNPDGDELQEGVSASVVGYSVDHDLAVLKVETKKLKGYKDAEFEIKGLNKDACAAKIATGYSLLDEAYVIGNAKDMGISVTEGRVSRYSEEVYTEMPTDRQEHCYRVMRINAASYEGNSGGGVFNAKGELIGILNAGLEDVDVDSSGNVVGFYGDHENFGFALPIDMVVPCVENLIYYGSVNPVYSVKTVSMAQLGVTLEESYVDFDETSGLLSYDVKVSEITLGSALTSKIQINDIITKLTIDSKTFDISWAHQIDDALMNARKTSTVKLKIKRGTAEQEVDISSVVAARLPA